MASLSFFLLFCTITVCLASTDNVTIGVEAATILTAQNNPKMNATYTLRLGVIGISETLGPAPEAVAVAAQYLNDNETILPDVQVQIYFSKYDTADSTILFDTLYHIKNLNVHGIIGAQTSQQSKIIQEIAKIFSVPQISHSALTSSFSDKSQNPTFLRMISSDASQVKAIIAFFQACGWKKGLVIYGPDEYGAGYSRLVAQAALVNITLGSIAAPQTMTTWQSFASTMETMKQLVATVGYRIFVLYMSGTANVQNCIIALNNTGLVGPEYVMVISGGASESLLDPNNALYSSPIIDGAFGIGQGLPSGDLYDTFLSYWQTQNITQYTPPYTSPFYAADAMFSYAYAVDSLMKNGVAFEDISQFVLLDQLVNQTFYGTTGFVKLDANGDRTSGRFVMYNLRANQTSRRVGTYYVATQNYTQLAPYIFYGNSTIIPADSPYSCASCIHGNCVTNVGCVCDSGYTGISCDVKKSSSLNVIPIIVPIGVATILIIVGAYFFYHKKRKALVKAVADKQRSQITRSDLVLRDRIGCGASGEVCKALFRGTDVAVKRIVTSVNKDVIEEFELEVAIMCGLRHPNIILFMGSCYDPTSHEMLLVMEFMSRGSLNDVLNNPRIPLTFEMKLALACQAAQGMNFLHMSSPPLVHRDLKSHNILIDDKWNARISDFGIAKFKEDTKKTRAADAKKEKSIGTIYWTAPEVLLGEMSTEKCDCYSFGIVLWEIFHRQNPYIGRDPMSVAMDVAHKNLRPEISDSLSLELKHLIELCWSRKPEDRPTFQEIVTSLRSLLANRGAWGNSSTDAGVTTDAPTGHVYLVATSVEEAYALWEAIPRGMEEAMKLHNQIIRKDMETYRGYEAAFEDHSFTAAFNDLVDAANFCVAAQMSLLHAQWPAELLSHPSCRAVYDGAAVVWNGLRVKMSLVSGVPNCEIDHSTGRMKYMGSLVEKTKQLLGLSNGYIFISDSVATEMTKSNIRLIHDSTIQRIGNKHDRVSINSLEQRNSYYTDGASDEPTMSHTVINVMDYDEDAPSTPKKKYNSTPTGDKNEMKKVSWVTAKSEIETKEAIGKGPIGDYFRGQWRGKEVAVKVLVNQRLKEDDMFKLIGDSAYMSKLSHPNILPFHAVCLEANYISVVSEFESRGNLKNLLADASVQLPWARKLKIALELAHGMSFLTSLPDSTLQMHDNLKSNNVLIGKEWEVKVADYGHANIRELARTMTSVGNIAWTAPEILNGIPATPKISLYSYGIILWELYTRQVPYVNEHPIKVVTRILSGYRPAVPADCPPAYKQIVEQCLDGEPENRPTWGAIISALSSLSS